LCSSKEYPYPPQGRLTEISNGRGVSKAQFLKGKYDTELAFPEGSWDSKTFRGAVWIF